MKKKIGVRDIDNTLEIPKEYSGPQTEFTASKYIPTSTTGVINSKKEERKH